jgi:hypothetical protein
MAGWPGSLGTFIEEISIYASAWFGNIDKSQTKKVKVNYFKHIGIYLIG